MTLDALDELVRYLGTLTDVRKTILTITEGWMLFRPDQALLEPRRHADDEKGSARDLPVTDPVPGTPGIVIRNGRLRTGDMSDRTSALYLCEADRMSLAALDDDRYFKEVIGDANRANASFYPIDPRGLPVFNAEVSVDRPSDVNLPLVYDHAMLRLALNSMRTLAENTDGVAVLDSNDLDRGLRRIAADLTAYYLLGYYSTNTKLDGKFHEIKVRVRRPGVEVRARRGYRSATAPEVAAARTAAAPPVFEPIAVVTGAISALSRLDSGAPIRIDAVPVPSATSPDVVAVWVSGELTAAVGADWLKGGTVTIELTVGSESATSELTVAPGQRAFLAPVVLHKPAVSGPLQVRAKLSGPSGTLLGSIRLETTGLLRPVVFRRGPSTGNRLQPAATFQFGRMERVHMEVPLGPDAKPGAGRLLDRGAHPLAVPVTLGERRDPETGQRWLTADITLAALGAGDYAVEMGLVRQGGEQRVITAIRVTR
jgi:VWFA-related protein